MQQVRNAGRSNANDGSVTRVVSAANSLSWVSPPESEIFKITADATLPDIVFEFRTDISGECKWSWSIVWEAKVSGLRERERKGTNLQTFKESGTFSGSDKRWVVNFAGKVLGGKLTVNVLVGKKKISREVLIVGQNPSRETVETYIDALDDMSGFGKLLEQETGCKHFIDLDGEPIVAFDKGYGITQMTNPAPSYEQAWNWKRNIDGGSTLYKEKVQAAKKYLGQDGRSYTDEQLQHEVFSRWNGGSYHEWDATSKAWVRKKNMLCDSTTGNVGWSTDVEMNQDKTEAELHERDKDTYKNGTKGQSSEHPWKYSGVCYADHVLGE